MANHFEIDTSKRDGQLTMSARDHGLSFFQRIQERSKVHIAMKTGDDCSLIAASLSGSGITVTDQNAADLSWAENQVYELLRDNTTFQAYLHMIG